MIERRYSPGLDQWVEVVETVTAGARRRQKRSDAFIVLPLAEAAAEFNALKCPTTLVWVALRYERWRQKGNTIRLPTALLRSWGLKSRTARARALARIERAGLVRVERRPGRAARVTFTSPQPYTNPVR
jgi:hypothetical protein